MKPSSTGVLVTGCVCCCLHTDGPQQGAAPVSERCVWGNVQNKISHRGLHGVTHPQQGRKSQWRLQTRGPASFQNQRWVLITHQSWFYEGFKKNSLEYFLFTSPVSESNMSIRQNTNDWTNVWHWSWSFNAHFNHFNIQYISGHFLKYNNHSVLSYHS